MKPPFWGLFGDTCETRLLQFLLPMYGIGFSMAELTGETGMTRQSVAKAIRKFSERGMVKIRKEGRTPLYSINEESPLVRRLEDFDNSLIESIVGPAEFKKIRDAPGEDSRKTSSGISGFNGDKIVFRHAVSKKAPCVSERSGTYRTKTGAMKH